MLNQTIEKTDKKEQKLTIAQAEVMQRLLWLYLLDEDLQEKLFSNIYNYTDEECKVLVEALDKALGQQMEVFEKMGEQDSDFVNKFKQAKQDATVQVREEKEKNERGVDQAELEKLEAEFSSK